MNFLPPTLSEAILNYPQAAPQDPVELVHKDPSEIRTLEGLTEEETKSVLQIRSLLVSVLRSADTLEPIVSLEVAAELLKKKHLRPQAYAWVIYPLDAKKNRISDQRRGFLSVVKHVAKFLPSPKELFDANVRIPENGTYLIIYGGSSEVLQHESVRKAIKKLTTQSRVADVLFWELEKDKSPTLWSLKAGCGEQDYNVKEFKDDSWVTECGF